MAAPNAESNENLDSRELTWRRVAPPETTPRQRLWRILAILATAGWVGFLIWLAANR
ncbi:MAG: hypothetical protein AAGF97_09100 [Planctomycetota bacterium]